MSYQRVIPRDLFNESKLLKCLGRLVIAIECREIKLTVDHDGSPFEIEQSEADGSLSVRNLDVLFGDKKINCYIPYNSKENWPLMAHYQGEYWYLFDENGKWMPEWGKL